jgi:hypothetical protein
MMEAMLAGCCVLTTGAGGAAEVALAANLPIFAAESPLYLAHILLRMELDREWMCTHARYGQKVALEKFTFTRMIDEINYLLRRVTDREEVSLSKNDENINEKTREGALVRL